jgi:hypothetical protein
MNGNSRQQVIPPARLSVKAGFVVYSHNDQERKIIILDKGELAAVDNSQSPRKIMFTMHPGDLVGVAALLEREPFRYDLEATIDSEITVVGEACMESELKNIPLWLLAVIRELSAKNRLRKEACRHSRAGNSLVSLAEFCRYQKKGKPYPLEGLIQEFCWQTKASAPSVKEDLKALGRRKFLEISGSVVTVTHPELLELFVDYLEYQEQDKPWPPLQLSLNQKKALVRLSIIEDRTPQDPPAWLAYFQKNNIALTAADWIKMQSLGWFKNPKENLFAPDSKKIQYFLLALRYEINLRGVL